MQASILRQSRFKVKTLTLLASFFPWWVEDNLLCQGCISDCPSAGDFRSPHYG